MSPLTFILPGPLDTKTGGFVYDRRMIEQLRSAGLPVEVIELPGDFPLPGPDAMERAARALRRLPEGSPVVVDGLALGALPTLAREQSDRLRLIALVHHPLAEETGLDDQLRARLRDSETEALASVRGVIVTSRFTARTLADYGVPPDRVRVVEPGTDPAALASGSADGPRQLLCVATFTQRKGHGVLFEAIARLTDLNWRLTCIGSTTRDPGLVAALRQQVANAGHCARVRLLDELDTAELEAHYLASDLFVLATYHEGYGMALAEALARGLPIVSTTAGAVPDTVPAAAGRLVPPRDANALEAALRDLLSDGNELDRLARGARQARTKLPDWNQAAERFRQALSDLLDT